MRFPSRFAFVALCMASLGNFASAVAQVTEPSVEEKKELLANQRFEEILKKKPRPGTALDRVYEFHIARGSLDHFCENLQNETEEKNSGQAALLLGLIQSQRGNDAEARAAFEKAEELLAEEPMASYSLGKTLLLIGDAEGAIAALQRAIDRKPEKADSLQIFQELGRVYQRLRRADDAINVWKRMEAMFPGDLQVQEQIANVLEEEGANAAALERFTALAAATKDRFRKVELGVRAAALKVKLNQHADALGDFEKLLSQINPGSWLHQDIRGRIDESFQSRQDTAGLTAYYQRWIDTHPEDIDAMMRIGRLLSIAHNSAAAKEWFNRAISRAPSAVEPRLALVESLERDGDSTAAAAAMQALSELQPDNPDYLVRWGELLLTDYRQPEAKRAAAAADVWRRLLDKNGSNPVMVSRVADLMRSANLSDEAIKLYTRAVELADSEPQYREYLGEYLHRLGRKEEAMKIWGELASGERKTRDNLVRLSEVLSTFAMKDEALTVMGQACQMQPTFGHRLRYSEKLIDATKYADASAQLQLASKQAGNEEEQDKVLEQEIKLHLASGDMAKHIEQLEIEIAQDDNSKSAAAWKRLALYQEADGKTQQALSSVNEALVLAPQSAAIINFAARIQEKAGFMGDAVASLRKLIALDRRGQSRVLMQIAAMHVRLGQMDQAIKTAQEMLAAADAGTEQYRYYADLCFQSGKVDQGLDALRRNMRANPNDREAIELLARALSNNFKTDEAIELTWRSFAKSNSTADKTQNVQTLAELYLRSNAFDDLVKRLEVYGREENRGREAVVLTATAHQASGDLAAARQLLEPLLTADSRDSDLLNTLIDLARADGDWDAAANYQAKLNNLSPTPEGGLQLAKFLLEKGDIEQAESIWNKYASQKMSAEDMQNNMRQLLLSGETDKVLGMIERALKNSPEDWEVLTVCMQMFYRAEKETQAKELAEKILNLNLSRDTLSENAKRQRSRRASNPQSNQPIPRNSSSPFAPSASADPTATDRLACLNRATQVVQVLNMERTNPMVAVRQVGVSAPAIVCYGDARLIALYFAKSRQLIEDAQQLANTVQTETNIDKLWDAAFLMNFGSSAETVGYSGFISSPPASLGSSVLSGGFGGTRTITTGSGSTVTYRATTNYTVPSNNTAALKRLSELDDREAQLSLVGFAVRQMQSINSLRQTAPPQLLAQNLNVASLDPKSLDEHLALLKKVQSQPDNGKNEQILLLSIFVASELKAVGRQDESQALLPFIKEHTRIAPKLYFANALVSLDMEAAIEIFIAAVKQTPGNNSSTVSGAAISNQTLEASTLLNDLLDRQQAIAGLETASAAASLNRSNPLRLISELKKLQAEKARRMRPSQLSTYTPSNPVRFLLRNNTRGNTIAVVPFPAASALQSSELLTAMYLVHQYPNNLYRDQLDRILRAEAAQADDDAMQSAVDHLCLAVWLWWSEQRDAALEEMDAVRKTAAANDLASMLSSRMYFESGRIKEALAQLQSLKPTTAQLMQERELAILQLASQSGETELAKQAAERLFAMRLPPQTQMQVANLMQQLGMTEMGSSMLQRLQRRGGNQLTTLSQLMSQYQRENKTAAAQEIARQILRRTRTNRNSAAAAGAQTANNSLRRQALQLLANAPETKEQITQLEEKIKNNPKSTSLIYQLAELYEATGRASESTNLLSKLPGNSKAAALSNVTSRLNTFRQTRSVESVKGYLEIFEKNPEVMDREFPYFQMAASQNNGWDTVAQTIADWPIEKLSNMRFGSSMIQQSITRGSSTSVEKLIKKLLEADDFMIRFGSAFMASGKRVKWSEDTQALITERVCKALVDAKLFPAYQNPIQYNVANQAPVAFGGHGSQLLTAVNVLIATPGAAKKVLETIAPLSAENPSLACMEVLMLLTADDRPAAIQALERVKAWPLTEVHIQPTWVLASELMTGREFSLATPLLEHIVPHYKDSGAIDSTPKGQLLSCYESTKSFEKAKPLLDEYYAEIQKRPPAVNDPFAGSQRNVQSVLRVGERYQQAGYSLEALSVALWLKGNSDLLSSIEAMYGSRGSNNPIMEQINRLENQAKDKLDAKAVGQLIVEELQPSLLTPTTRKLTLPVSMFVPEIKTPTRDQTSTSCQLRDLLIKLNEADLVKLSVKQTLDGLAKDNWQGMNTRNLLCALYLADFLQQNDDYVSAARQLNKLLTEEVSTIDKSSSAKEVQDAKALRDACWLIAETLIPKDQPELAQELARHATSLDAAPSIKALQMRLRLARSLKDARQPAAAETHMKELLEQLYPAKAAQPSAAQLK